MPNLPKLVGTDGGDHPIAIKNDLDGDDLFDGEIDYKKNGRRIRRAFGQQPDDSKAKLSQIKEQLKKNGRFVLGNRNAPGKKVVNVAKKIDFEDIFGIGMNSTLRDGNARKERRGILNK